MKNKFKIYKILLFFAVVLFIGCSKDDYNIQQSQKDTNKVLRDRTITGNEALSIGEKLNAQLGNAAGLNKGESSYGTIDFTEIRNVLDMSGKDNYTFRVLNHPESSRTVFFNLVMIQRENYTTVMLVKYEMDPAFADAYYNKTKDFLQFNGTVSFSLVSSNDPCPPVPPKPVTPNPTPGGGGGGQGDSPDTSPDQGSGSDSGLWQMYMTMYYAEHAGDSANNWTGNSNDTGSSSGGGIIPPRFFRMALSTNNPTKDPCDKGNTIGVLDPQVYAQFNAFVASLSDDQESWLYNNSTTAGLLLDYLNDNGFSDSSIKFTKNIIADLEENPIPVYDIADYPGKNDGMPFEWWKDDTYMKQNLIMMSENNLNTGTPPNLLELLLFAAHPSDAILHIANGKTALNKAQQLATSGILTHTHNGKADAFRHAYWNALDTVEIGESLTALFTTAHEWASGNQLLETQMDLTNNQQGINIGKQYSFSTPDQTIANAVMVAINDGFLVYLTPLGNNENGNNILPSTQMKPTNQ